jgi:hypothetical protein
MFLRAPEWNLFNGRRIVTQMRAILKVMVCLGAGILLGNAQTNQVALSDDRFGRIQERNLFGLKAPEQPRVESPSTPVPQITLAGITTVLGDKRALLKTQPRSDKPGAAAKEESLILAEGQREGPLEVLTINVSSGTVRVNNSGTIMTLDFEKNGQKLATPAANAAPPRSLPTVNAAPGAVEAAQTNLIPIPSPSSRNHRARSSRWPAPAAVAMPTKDGTMLSPTGADPLPLTSAPPAAQPIEMQNLTPEEQAIIQQLQQQAPGAQTGPSSPSLPSAPVSGTVIAPPGAKPPNTVPTAISPPVLPQ